MAKKPEKRGLGRGLSALMADIDGPAQTDLPTKTSADQTIEITRVFANPDQPVGTRDDNTFHTDSPKPAGQGFPSQQPFYLNWTKHS